jgi:hypothetical protein
MEETQSLQRQFELETSSANQVEPLRKIRIETVLSKFPIHTLSKTGKVDICITDSSDNGQRKLLWKVTPNAAYGEPRALAYKLDTLVINRTLDEIGRPLPELIRLGSLREIAKVLGLGGNTNDVKRALRQNAHAVIAAKLQYTDTENKQRDFEFETTRYGVIFSGETLPTGSRADAVYLTLNPTYRAILNSAPLRPLDYNYLKELPPAAQRFYEVISYRVFAALLHLQPKIEPTVRIRYSDYCTLSAQKRSFNWNNVRPQMSEVHKPHIKSGYLRSARFEKRLDPEGNADWMICYEVGPKAKAEFSAFTKKEQTAVVEAEHIPLPNLGILPPAPYPDAALPIEPNQLDQELVFELTRRGITRKKATQLLSNLQPGQQVIDQLEWGDNLIARGTFRNPPGLLISFIEMNLTPPSYFESTRSRKLREAAQVEAAEDQVRRFQLQSAYEEYRKERIEQYIDEELDPEEYKRLFTVQKKELSVKYKSLHLNPTSLTELAHGGVRTVIMARIALLTFEQFIREQNVI